MAFLNAPRYAVPSSVVPVQGPKTTAVNSLGFNNSGAVDFSKTGVGGESFGTFGCKVFNPLTTRTPDWQASNAYFERKTFDDGVLTMSDGALVGYWGFEDRIKAKGLKFLPSPLIRVQEGDMVHVKLESRFNTHTIHHHGIEPTTMNDGVGHVSFEVSDAYVYQWQPKHAGTWFYHCHKNTVLHFEMGLYGLLVVDPKPDQYGRVCAYKGGPYYNRERFWVFDDIDPAWRALGHDAGMCGEDVGLNVFRPKYFLVNGVENTKCKVDTGVRIDAKLREKVLIRMLNASYSVVKVTIEGLRGDIISVDGHALDSNERPWTSWMPVEAGNPMFFSTATRQDLLIDLDPAKNPVVIGREYKVVVEFQDWIKRTVHNANAPKLVNVGRAETVIKVT
jgi:Multicopper oxidase